MLWMGKKKRRGGGDRVPEYLLLTHEAEICRTGQTPGSHVLKTWSVVGKEGSAVGCCTTWVRRHGGHEPP